MEYVVLHEPAEISVIELGLRDGNYGVSNGRFRRLVFSLNSTVPLDILFIFSMYQFVLSICDVEK